MHHREISDRGEMARSRRTTVVQAAMVGTYVTCASAARFSFEPIGESFHLHFGCGGDAELLDPRQQAAHHLGAILTERARRGASGDRNVMHERGPGNPACRKR